VETLKDVLENALAGKGKARLVKRLETLQPSVISKVDLESEKAVAKMPVRKGKSKKSPAGETKSK